LPIFTGIADEVSLHRKLGSSDFTLACLLDFPKSAEGDHLSACFPSTAEVIDLVRQFISSIMRRNNFDHANSFLGSTINLAAVFVRHGQYEAAQVPFLFTPKFIIYIFITHKKC
jgi:nuclear pore complex protein Nup160